MPNTDLVPTFVDGQHRATATPQYRTREACREARNRGEGLFCDNGQSFVFFRAIVHSAPLNDDQGVGYPRVSANSRTKGLLAPERLHYPIPAVGEPSLVMHCRDVNFIPKIEESAPCA